MPSSVSLKAAVSVSEMARMVGLSRGRFYELVKQGVFLPPVYTLDRKPFFTEPMQRQNLEVRQTQLGVNGQYVLFYDRQQRSQRSPAATRSRLGRPEPAREFTHRLRSLGLEGLTVVQVRQAMADCFPDGIDGQDEAEVLRTVYRHIRRSGGA